MKILERGSILVAVIGLVMKIEGLDGGSLLLLLGLAFLSMVYFYLGFALFNGIPLKTIFNKSLYAGITSARIAGAIAVGGLISIITVGALFKLLLLTGAREMLAIGVTGLALTLFAAGFLFVFKRKKMSSFYRRIFVKGGIAIVVGVTLYLISTSTLIRFYYRDDPAYAELYVKAVENPQGEKIQREFEDAQEKRNK